MPNKHGYYQATLDSEKDPQRGALVLKRYPIPIRRLCNLKLAFVGIQVLQWWLVGKIMEVYQQPLEDFLSVVFI